MHSYLRSIGFGRAVDRRIVEQLVKEICEKPDECLTVSQESGKAFFECRKEYAPGCGLAVCGEIDDYGQHREYYFPYFRTETVSSDAPMVVEKHAGTDSYAGVCEDDRIGASMIYYLQNPADLKKELLLNGELKEGARVSFTGLAAEGKILLPVQIGRQISAKEIEAEKNRYLRIAAAKNGDSEAMESLTIEDMDNYSMISRRLEHEDIYSIISTYFMPYGIECDRYQLLAEIRDAQKVENVYSKEAIWQLKLSCNDMDMDICINEEDLYGEPKAGYRFKGNFWLQGRIVPV